MNKIYLQNLIKNFLLIVLLVLSYFEILRYFNEVNAAQNAGDLLVATSIIAVIACFGCFAFTYEKVLIKRITSIYLAHATTGLLMLILGISVIMGAELTTYLIGQHFLIQGTWYLLYVATVFYDFWDLERIFLK